jgi:hypothetical protein
VNLQDASGDSVQHTAILSEADARRLFSRYQELQRYAAWSADGAARVHTLAPLLQSHLPALVEDFYEEIERHPDAAKVITGGQEQIAPSGLTSMWHAAGYVGRPDIVTMSPATP